MVGECLFLGSGASLGVPIIGCSCPVCRSSLPSYRRLRPSALITLGEKKLLIDVGPDFREQALRYSIDHLDGLFITHPHYDHMGGFDDLRMYYLLQKKSLPCLLSRETFQELVKRNDYFFHTIEKDQGLQSRFFSFHFLEKDFGSILWEDIPISYGSYYQRKMKVSGIRIGSFAYISDIRFYPSEIFSFLKGVSCLVLSALRSHPSGAHFSLEEAIRFAQKVEAEQVWFTHLSHEIDQKKIEESLPVGVSLAYDGLKILFPSR